MTGAETRIIFASEHLEVLFRPGTSAYGIITFNPATHLANGKTMWGQTLADRGDLTAIGVMARRPTWFPLDDMEKAAEPIRHCFEHFQHVVSYGSSMGAYGALKFAKLLRVTHAVSFAPQWSIDPVDVGDWDRRFINAFNSKIHTRVAIESSDLPSYSVLLYDPFMAQDRINAERILSLSSKIDPVYCYLTDHFPVTLFKGTANITALFQYVLDGKIDTIRRVAQENRRNPDSPERARAAATMMVNRNIRLAQKIYASRRSSFGMRETAMLFHAMSWKLANIGEIDEAREHSDIAIDNLPDTVDFYKRRVLIERLAGAYENAVTFARGAAARWPSSTDCQILLSESLRQAQRNDEAKLVIENALALEPRSEAALSIKLSLLSNAHQKSLLAGQIHGEIKNYKTALWYADALLEAGYVRKAEEPLKFLLDIEPNDQLLWSKLSQAYARQQRWDLASEAAEKAAQIKPEDFMVHIKLAQSLNAYEKKEAALKAVDRALELRPGHSQATIIRDDILKSVSLPKAEERARPKRTGFLKWIFR
jgi:tetratricopeptide (TPR) repeat protein